MSCALEGALFRFGQIGGFESHLLKSVFIIIIIKFCAILKSKISVCS